MKEDAQKINDFFTEGVRHVHAHTRVRSYTCTDHSWAVVKCYCTSVCVYVCPQGCSESLWFSEVLCSIAEVLRLQDPGSVQLELVSLARAFPDLR